MPDAISPEPVFLIDGKPPCSQTICDRTAWCTRRRYAPGEEHNGSTPEHEAMMLEKIGHVPAKEPTSSRYVAPAT